MHEVRTYWNHLLGPGGVHLFGPLFRFSFFFNEKGECALIGTSFLAAGGATLIWPKGPVHLFGGFTPHQFVFGSYRSIVCPVSHVSHIFACSQ